MSSLYPCTKCKISQSIFQYSKAQRCSDGVCFTCENQTDVTTEPELIIQSKATLQEIYPVNARTAAEDRKMKFKIIIEKRKVLDKELTTHRTRSYGKLR